MNRFLSVLIFLFSCSFASAQPVQQSGSITPGHPVMWNTNGVVRDAGTAVNGFLTGVGVVAQGPSICTNSAPVTSGAYQQLCLSVTTGGPGQIILQNFGAAAPQKMQVVINGTAFDLPFSGASGFVTGPVSSVVNDFACWAGTTGNVLNDCASKTGNTNKISTFNGALNNGHCVSIDASGNLVDAGGPCTTGGGGGTVNAGTANNLAYYVTSTNAVSGLANGTAGLPLIEGSPPTWATLGSAGLSAGAAATNVGTLGGDLSGTLPNPTVAKVNGTSVPATPSANQVLVASSGSAATWTAVANAALATMPADTVKCNNTGSPATPLDCVSVITQNYTSLTTASFFSNQTPASNLIRFGDKLLGGDISSNANNVTAAGPPLNGACSSGDWFSNFEATTSNTACGYWASFAMAVTSKSTTIPGFANFNPSSGILGAGQTLNNNFGGAIGIMGFALGNNVNAGTTGPVGAGGGWGGYFECDMIVNATHAGCFGIEVEAGNFVSDAYSTAGGFGPDPYAQTFVNGVQIGCGSGLATPTPFKCAAGLQIVDVGNQYRVGINIMSGSIVAGGGPNGETVGIAMPTGYVIEWYGSRATVDGGIDVDNSNNFNINVAGSIHINGNTTFTGTCSSLPVVLNGLIRSC